MLKTLTLQNFRNYEEKKISFSSGLTIITGENGKGKTNILEAISALAFIKPFRTNKKDVFIMHQKEFSRISGVIISDEIDNINAKKEKLDIFWGVSLGKNIQLKRNDIILSSTDFMKEKKFLAVIFSPEDLNIPFLSPQYRRTFLSRLLSSLFPDYFSSALRYKSVLKQRNILLKKFHEGKTKKNEFDFWNRELTTHQRILQKYHSLFFDFANQYIEKEYKKISGKGEWVQITPLYSCEDSDEFMSLLEQRFEKDCWRGSTSIGVHRDDFSLFLRGLPINESASRGETRSVLLALKKIEEFFIEHYSGIKPILLLDDVFSELDHSHQKHLLQSIKNQQCVITTTEVEINIADEKNVMHIAL